MTFAHTTGSAADNLAHVVVLPEISEDGLTLFLLSNSV